MKDFTLKKPNSIKGYPIHRTVADLVNGAPHLWRDNGESLTIRTASIIDAEGVALPSVELNELRIFNLRASVSSKVRGRHFYPPSGDHKARQAWLIRQGQRHGFQVVSVHSTSDKTQIADNTGRDFAMDATDFTGVLKITDVTAFENALRSGVGSTGKAFGFSLLSI